MYLTRKALAAAPPPGPGGRHGSEGTPGPAFGGAEQRLVVLDPMDDDADSACFLLLFFLFLFCLSKTHLRITFCHVLRSPVQQLEDLLETYFAQIDHAYNRMRALDEYVGSTEDVRRPVLPFHPRLQHDL